MTPNRQCAGFSMIELSIVMIIIGLIIAGSISVYEPSMKQTLKNKNETIVRHAVETLIGFAGAHKSLPGAILNTGVVNSVQDAQLNPLQYAFDADLTAVNSICRQDETRLTVEVLKSDGSVAFSVSQVAFVIWSRGYDGKSLPDKAVGAVESAVRYSVPVYAEGQADDLVGWATLSELQAAVGCGGSGVSILADAVPAGSVGLKYGVVTFTPDGGRPPYAWCVEFPDVTRSGKVQFASGDVVLTPVAAFGGCREFPVVGAVLTMSGVRPFVSTDQGGPYDFVVHLKDGNHKIHAVNRRFSLFVTP
ncbi:MAG: prepilin-type N-terminal cleavage/methylation domain-containing protein [Magnetococcales bacterium]|nr:prepilin-type N-terminal cleavage/methylation domain-containing protein [Magnetococcales bacterium]